MINVLDYHLSYPLIGFLIYLSYPKSLKIFNTKKKLFVFTLIHNLGLSLFSLYTFITMINIIYYKGIKLESNYYFSDQTFDKIIFYFYLSKYYEYIDTLLLYFQDKEPIFLQKFHHVGATIGWHLSYYYKVDCIWIATTFNSLVHTVMYLYYFFSLFKVKGIKKIKIFITMLQLIQLFCAVIFAPILYFGKEKPLQYYIILFFSSYVAILIILFIKFAKKEYIDKEDKDDVKKEYIDKDNDDKIK